MAWTRIGQDIYHEAWEGTAIEADGTNSSSNIDAANWDRLDIQTLHASHSDTSTWVVQWSNDDGTTWETLTTSSALTTSGAAGSTSVTIDGVPGRLLRLAVTEADGNASATLTPYLCFKRKVR